MNRKEIIILLFTILGVHLSQAQQILQPGFLVACGDDKVLIIDPAKSNDSHTEILWKWEALKADDIPAEIKNSLKSLDECKPVMKNQKILVNSSSGATVLVDIKTKAVEFYAKTPMAHSVDLLPNNRIAVANSTHPQGNSLEIYDLSQNNVIVLKDTLYSGHGVVWNQEEETLYVLGMQLLKAYSLQNWNTNEPSLSLERSWKIPDISGHDLFKVSENVLLITTHNDVFTFDTKREEFAVFDPMKGKKDVKSVNYFPESNSLIYTIAEESWWTHNIYISSPKKTLRLPDLKLYKVRVAN